MLPRIAALLSSIVIGTVSATGFLSRLSFVVSRNAASTIAADAATELTSRMSGFVHVAAPIGGHAMSLLLHIALAPANATLSLLAATWRIACAATSDALHPALLYLLHWM